MLTLARRLLMISGFLWSGANGFAPLSASPSSSTLTGCDVRCHKARHHRRHQNQKQLWSTTTEEEVEATNTLEGRKIVGDILPINNFIFVKTVGIREKTDDGILIAGKSKIVKTQGTVVSVGPGRTHPESGRRIDIPLQKGDGIVYGEYDGIEIDWNDSPHMLVRDTDVLVTYDGEALTEETVGVIYDKVLIRVDSVDQQTAGGLLLASARGDENKPSTGTVVRVGPGRMAGDGSIIPMRVKVGDNVKFRDYATSSIEFGGVDYSVVGMEDILATF